MTQLPSAARVYIGAVIAAAVAVLAIELPTARFDQPGLFVVLLAVASAAAAMKVSLPLTTGGSTMSISYAVDFAALLLLGRAETMLVAAGSAFSQCHINNRERNPLYRTLFSIASLVLTVEGAGLTMARLADMGGQGAIAPVVRPLVGAATAYFVLNTCLIATAVALSTRERVSTTWQTNFLWSAPGYFIGALMAACAASLITHAGYWLSVLTLAPVYATYQTYKVYMGRIEDEQRHVRQTSDLHLATIEALARAIDAKDQMAHSHIRRVQTFAAGLARAIGLSASDTQGVKTAALLHDIGKLAIPEHILSKPGPLSDEEFQKIRIHPQIGAEIIAGVPFPYPVTPLILSHHERWDGNGYPNGLAGEAIPIGARILAIVDYYDAVTSERPYHRALSHEAGLRLLQEEAGRALDPQLVQTFIDIFPALMEEARAAEAVAFPSSGREAVRRGEPVGPGPLEGAPSAFENIALAHREIYALYEIAQSMGTSLSVADTMALISSKLRKIVPWSGCALFLQGPRTGTLACRYAVGIDAARLVNAVVPIGSGLAGWVAENRRTLVNGDPRVAFEAAGVSTDTELRSAIVCPLFIGDMLIGCLSLYHTRANAYHEDHRRLLERIAEQAGPVIHNSIVFEQTQEDSLTDPLTSLPNRRSMFSYLTRELARCDRAKEQMALIVMDIDEFKAINDTYGHHVGDRALRQVAAVLQEGLRSYDLCVRYAGDEFIAVIPECSWEQAEAKRVELQQRVAEIEMEVLAGRRIRLGASAGAAVFPHDGRTYEALIAEADSRMYRNKAARRAEAARPNRRMPTVAARQAVPSVPVDDEPTPLAATGTADAVPLQLK
jgi:diguanylate cyclase (GGDEF)-like protein/putative nucleotidyltransferase with HDIG domain